MGNDRARGVNNRRFLGTVVLGAERSCSGTLNPSCAVQEPIFETYLIDAGNLMRGMVSCTGSQFCGIAMIETKNRAMAIVQKLESQLDIPKVVRMHWTGCPNSCGQVRHFGGK